MRCTLHPIDQSSLNEVCASCLRERLFAVISAQAQADARAETRHVQNDRRKSDANPPPLHFPRSVSPYISQRKFFSTPEIGPTAMATASVDKKSKLSLLSNLFKFRTGKRVSVSDHSVSDSMTSFSGDESSCGISPLYEEEWKRKPKVSATSAKRSGGGMNNNSSWNVSGIGFCLSPLVRAEVDVSGESRVQEKRRHSIALPVCKNRSRKLVDYWRNGRKH